MPLPRPVDWWLKNKWLVAVISLFVLAGSMVLSRMSDDPMPSEPSAAGPGFEAPPKTKLPKLTRASVESLVKPPPGQKLQGSAEGESEAEGEAKAASGGRRAGVMPPDIAAAAAAAGSASAAAPRPGGKLEKMVGFGKGEGSGGGGGGPSARGGSGAGGGPGEGGDRAPSLAAGQGGASSFMKRQFANASRRLARVLGGSGAPRQAGFPGGNATAASGNADKAPGGRTEIGASGGLPVTGNGASTPRSSNSTPPASGPTNSSRGGGVGPAPAAAPKPVTPATPTPKPAKHNDKREKDPVEAAAAGTADAGAGVDSCSKNKSTTKCAVLTCIEPFEFWRLNPELSRELHAPETSMPTGLIVPHILKLQRQYVQDTPKIKALYDEASAMEFGCDEDGCMQPCPGAAADAIRPAMVKAESMAATDRLRSPVANALYECEGPPFEKDGREQKNGQKCKVAGDEAKLADVELAKLIKDMSKAAECRAEGTPDDVARWGRWSEKLKKEIDDLSKTYDKPFCPDRTKCTAPPRAQEYLRKMDKDTAKVEVFREDLPTVVSHLILAHTDSNAALGFLPRVATDEGALRDFVFANDRAAFNVLRARQDFLAAKALACRDRDTSTDERGQSFHRESLLR